MLNHFDENIRGKSITISGSGNVALYAAQKAIQKKAKVLTMSDSNGYIYTADGLNGEQLDFLIDLKENKRGRISEMARKFKAIEYQKNEKPWQVPCDIAIPCATQNELDKDDVEVLIKNGLSAICEGANMPSRVRHQK